MNSYELEEVHLVHPVHPWLLRLTLGRFDPPTIKPV